MDKKAAVLVVEDSALFLEANARILRKKGYEVLPAKTLAAARSYLHRVKLDAVVLDIILPDGNGLDFIYEIRRSTTAPVLVVTSLDSKNERLKGLRAGADDYITKPFDSDELVARVGAFLRREAMHRHNPVRKLVVGPIVLNTVSGSVFLHGREMRLTPKEFGVLLLLVQNEGRGVAKEQIYREVWEAPMSGDGRTVRTTVSRLRKKLEDEENIFIDSTREEGYQLIFRG